MRLLQPNELKGKKVLVRVDLNSPVEGGQIVINPRFYGHAETVRQLSRAGACLVLISHQGRKGDDDFTSMEKHAKLLQECSGKPIRFIPAVTGELVKKEISQLEDGEIILLDNVRNLDDETKGNPYDATLVRELAPLVDIFVMDAFSIAHREHASVIGFMKGLPSYPGPVLSGELRAL